MKLKKGKLTTSVIVLSIAPLLAFGTIVLFITSGVIYHGLREEVKYSLNVSVHSSYQIFDLSYPGDYNCFGRAMSKGSQRLEGRFELVDNVKQETGTDATLFCGNLRYLTTIRNPNGTRAVGTSAEQEVVDRVLNQQKEYFSDHVLVNGTPYFGYYMPVENSDGTVVGMLFSGKPRSQVMKNIDRNILLVCLCAICVLGIATAVSLHFSRKLIHSLDTTEDFLRQIAQGDLTAEVDPYLLNRQDEIGAMGRFALLLRDSISNQVGTDTLTGLPNRRSCDIVLESLAEKSKRSGSVFTVVMGDIDYFKRVNDTYGHQAGDAILKELSHRISSHMERLGFVFRWGGEEFLLVYEDIGRGDVIAYLKELQKEISSTGIPWNGESISVTITFGVADSTESSDVQELIHLVDHNLYTGKNQGRNRIVSR